MSNTLKILCRKVTSFLHSSQIQQYRSIMSTGQQTAAIVAVGQMCATDDKVANMRQVEELVKQAKAKQANLLFLPECCDFVAKEKSQLLTLAEPLNGALMAQYRELAKSNQIWLSLGGLHELKCPTEGEEPNKMYNAHVVLNDQGDLVGVYRKLHLFDVKTPEITLMESSYVAAGRSLERPMATPAGRLGLQICYDLRFAETALLLRKMGAQLLSYPSAFTYTTGKAHWELLLRARAVETQCFVIAAAQQGWHNAKRQSWGHAMIVSPWGKVLAECGEQALAVATAEVDLSTLDKLYQSMPCFEHRRNDIYSLTAYNLPMPNEEDGQDRAFANNIVDKRTIFYESEHCYAFTNLRCVVEGHVLVSTKRVTPRLNGLNCAEITDLFATVCMVQRLLERIYGTTSATVTVQDGAQAGQTVPHVHFHVMPRRTGDFGHNDQIYVKLDDRAENLPPRTLEERIEEAQKYRKCLQDMRS